MVFKFNLSFCFKKSSLTRVSRNEIENGVGGQLFKQPSCTVEEKNVG